MKTRLLIRGTAAIAAAAGLWTAWNTVRHARENLVTLRGRDLPLAKALDRIERQTRERLVADERFTADPQLRVHLDLRAAPLAEAMAVIAEQTGGFWRTTYAVHDRPEAARQLAGLLAKGADPTQSGWTNLTAPDPGMIPPPPGEGPLVRPFTGGGPPPGVQGEEGGRRVVVVDAEETVRGPRPGPVFHHRGAGGDPAEVDIIEMPAGTRSAGAGGSELGPRGRPVRRVIVRAIDQAGGEPSVLDLSPERLLAESRLLARAREGALPGDLTPAPADAERLARATGGRWSMVCSLEVLPVPGLQAEMGRMLTRNRSGSATGQPPSEGTEAIPAQARGPTELAARAEAEIRRGQFDRIERLTPEQRARQAAQAAARPETPQPPRTEERE